MPSDRCGTFYKEIRIENEPFADFLSCGECKHCDDSLEVCMQRRCIHAFSTLKECFTQKEHADE